MKSFIFLIFIVLCFIMACVVYVCFLFEFDEYSIFSLVSLLHYFVKPLFLNLKSRVEIKEGDWLF